MESIQSGKLIGGREFKTPHDAPNAPISTIKHLKDIRKLSNDCKHYNSNTENPIFLKVQIGKIIFMTLCDTGNRADTLFDEGTWNEITKNHPNEFQLIPCNEVIRSAGDNPIEIVGISDKPIPLIFPDYLNGNSFLITPIVVQNLGTNAVLSVNVIKSLHIVQTYMSLMLI